MAKSWFPKSKLIKKKFLEGKPSRSQGGGRGEVNLPPGSEDQRIRASERRKVRRIRRKEGDVLADLGG